MGDERLYTVEEADALLPDLRERLARIREARQVLLREAELVKEKVVADVGGATPGPAYREASATLRAELERLSAEDILLRDPETGLIDFPARLHGREVYLCWRLGEREVTHWHEIQAGFAGRQQLKFSPALP